MFAVHVAEMHCVSSSVNFERDLSTSCSVVCKVYSYIRFFSNRRLKENQFCYSVIDPSKEHAEYIVFNIPLTYDENIDQVCL